MLRLEAGNHICKRLDDSAHPERISVEHIGGVHHDADMAGEENRIAALQARVRIQRIADALALQIAVARHLDARLPQSELDEARAVDPARATSAPDIGLTDLPFRRRNLVRFVLRERHHMADVDRPGFGNEEILCHLTGNPRSRWQIALNG